MCRAFEHEYFAWSPLLNLVFFHFLMSGAFEHEIAWTFYLFFSFEPVLNLVSLLNTIVMTDRRSNSTTSNVKFHLNIKLNPECATTRSIYQRALSDKEECQRLWSKGKKHIDLWSEGSLYPANPKTRRYPPFHTPHDLIFFVGDGDNGLLGYFSRLLESYNHQHVQFIHHFKSTILLNEKQIKELENWIIQLKKHFQIFKQTPIGLRERIKLMRGAQDLTNRSSQRKTCFKIARDHVTNILGWEHMQ